MNLLRDLIAAAKAAKPSCRFMAWTPGLPAPEIAALRDCGLDFTVASTCWWDFKDEWYLNEQARLDAVAPPLALAEAPFGHRLAEQFASSEDLERGYRRVSDQSGRANILGAAKREVRICAEDFSAVHRTAEDHGIGAPGMIGAAAVGAECPAEVGGRP